MGWVYLAFAGALEVAFTTALKYADGFTRLVPSVLFVIAYAGSAWLLSKSIATIPLGTAYAVWTGIGAIGTAVVGMALFNDPATPLRLVFLAVIVAGIAGLKFVSN
jgi:quaternary ammonium compound-resistance protein SugE